MEYLIEHTSISQAIKKECIFVWKVDLFCNAVWYIILYMLLEMLISKYALDNQELEQASSTTASFI